MRIAGPVACTSASFGKDKPEYYKLFTKSCNIPFGASQWYLRRFSAYGSAVHGRNSRNGWPLQPSRAQQSDCVSYSPAPPGAIPLTPWPPTGRCERSAHTRSRAHQPRGAQCLHRGARDAHYAGRPQPCRTGMGRPCAVVPRAPVSPEHQLYFDHQVRAVGRTTLDVSVTSPLRRSTLRRHCRRGRPSPNRR